MRNLKTNKSINSNKGITSFFFDWEKLLIKNNNSDKIKQVLKEVEKLKAKGNLFSFIKKKNGNSSKLLSNQND